MTNPFVWVGRYELATLVMWLLVAGAILAFALLAGWMLAGAWALLCWLQRNRYISKPIL